MGGKLPRLHTGKTSNTQIPELKNKYKKGKKIFGIDDECTHRVTPNESGVFLKFLYSKADIVSSQFLHTQKNLVILFHSFPFPE